MSIRRHDGFSDWVQHRGGWLVSCAYLLTHDNEAALDLTQETLERAWTNRERVINADNHEAYVLRIMLNLFRDTKRLKRLTLVSLDEASTLVWQRDQLSQVEATTSLLQVIGTLSQRQQAVLVLRYWADLTDSDIAVVLGCRQATVRSLAARALHSVRNRLEVQNG